jgi:hypothetical protein
LIEVELQKKIDQICAGLSPANSIKQEQAVDLDKLKGMLQLLSVEQRRQLLAELS